MNRVHKTTYTRKRQRNRKESLKNKGGKNGRKERTKRGRPRMKRRGNEQRKARWKSKAERGEKRGKSKLWVPMNTYTHVVCAWLRFLFTLYFHARVYVFSRKYFPHTLYIHSYVYLVLYVYARHHTRVLVRYSHRTNVHTPTRAAYVFYTHTQAHIRVHTCIWTHILHAYACIQTSTRVLATYFQRAYIIPIPAHTYT